MKILLMNYINVWPVLHPVQNVLEVHLIASNVQQMRIDKIFQVLMAHALVLAAILNTKISVSSRITSVPPL